MGRFDCIMKNTRIARHYQKFFFFYTSTVKPVLRGHLQEKEKWPYKAGDLLKEVQFNNHCTEALIPCINYEKKV